MHNQETNNENFVLAAIGGVFCFALAAVSAGMLLLELFSGGFSGYSSNVYSAIPLVLLVLSIIGVTYIPKLAFAHSKNPAEMSKRYNRILLLVSPLALLAILLFNIVSQGR